MDLLKKAQVVDGVVVNIIVVDPREVPEWCANWPDGENAQIGGKYENGVFYPPEG
jgi:hypothetical protein